MGDYFYSSLAVGGTLSDEAAGELVEVLTDRGLRTDTGDRIQSVEDLRAALTEGECLRLVDEQARDGEFTAVEEFCHTYGLAYERSHDGYFEIPAATKWWQPGMESPREIETTGLGDVALAATDVERALEAETDAERVAAVRALLVRVQPPELPPLRIAPARDRPGDGPAAGEGPRR